MTRVLSFLLLLLMSVNGMWELHWSSDSRNSGLIIITDCGKAFYAFDRADITDEMDAAGTVRMRRQRTPPGVVCTFYAQLMRLTEDGTSETAEEDAQVTD